MNVKGSKASKADQPQGERERAKQKEKRIGSRVFLRKEGIKEWNLN